MVFADCFLLLVVIELAFSLRLEEWFIPNKDLIWLILLSPLCGLPVFYAFGLYRNVTRYIGFNAVWKTLKAVSLYALIWGVIVLMSGAQTVPRLVIIINWFLGVFAITASRITAQWFLLYTPSRSQINLAAIKNVVIYGAGNAGMQLAASLSSSRDMKVVRFLDDDPALINQQINGIHIQSFDKLSDIIRCYNVTEVLLAIPSASRNRRSKIITMLEPYSVHVRTMPSVDDLVRGVAKIQDLREVYIEDLLGREPVAPNKLLMGSNITGKAVMVSGAGGSIGSELCVQIVQLRPKKLVLIDQSEFGLYQIDNLLNDICDVDISIILGSVTNQKMVEIICRKYKIQTVYHAAAYKHVPIVEMNTIEASRNNVLGTFNAALAALNTKVETFVLISTDKAVRPASIMGATKRLAELVMQSLSKLEKTRFIIVRFGNVLASSGSVIPLFKNQIATGGPVTVTDPKVMRYFMLINEAAQLVIQAGAMGRGGDVFVLDMGEPIRILDLANRMIRLSGLSIKNEENPDGDIEIKFIGMRKGEKMFEELLIGKDVQPTEHSKIMRANEEMIPWEELEPIIENLSIAIERFDSKKIIELFSKAMPEFQANSKI